LQLLSVLLILIHLMDKFKTLVITIILVFLAFIAAWFSLFNKFKIFPPKASSNPTSNIQITETQQNVSLKVVFPDDNVNYIKEFKAENNETAYSILTEALEIRKIPYETKKYDFGVFVKSIKGLESTAQKSWIYFVNGESGAVAADQYRLQAGDKVEWKYIPPSGE